MRVVFFILAPVLLASSCATRPPEAPLPFDLPETFSDSGRAVLPDAWWETLGDSGLNAWMETALSGSLTLRSAWDRLSQAEASAAAQGASRYPSVDVDGSVTRYQTTTDNGEGDDTSEEYGAGLGAYYEVDIWGRIRSVREAAALDTQATREQVQAAAITLSARIALAWIQRAEQTGQEQLLLQQLSTNERILELLRHRFRTGRSSAVDVLQQEQLVESRRGDLVYVRARLRVLENQLTLLAGQPARTALPEPRALSPLPEMPAAGVPADLIQRRPDVRTAYLRVLAADQRVAVAVADRFPRLSLSARVGASAPEAGDLFSDWISSLAANLAGPLIDGGLRKAEVERSRASLSEAIHDYGQSVLVSINEVEDAMFQERRQQELVESLARQLDLATRVTERLRDRYLHGSEDFLRLLSADLSQQGLERALLSAGRQRIEYRIALCRALSGGFPVKPPGPPEKKTALKHEPPGEQTP